MRVLRPETWAGPSGSDGARMGDGRGTDDWAAMRRPGPSGMGGVGGGVHGLAAVGGGSCEVRRPDRELRQVGGVDGARVAVEPDEVGGGARDDLAPGGRRLVGE